MSRILVAFDGSMPSRRALERAKEEALAQGHELVLLTVVPPQVKDSSLSSMMPAGLALPPQLSQTFEQSARLRLDEHAAQLAAAGVKALVEVRAGETAPEVLRAARELDVAKIVIGRKSYDKKEHVGPNAQAIREGASVPVTMVQ